MPLFVCQKCGNIENTALSLYWERNFNKKELLCSECDPNIKKWHGKFTKEKFDEKKWEIERGNFIKLK